MMAKRLVIVVLLVWALLPAAFPPLMAARQEPGRRESSTSLDVTEAHVQTMFAQLPLYFIENRGQLDERVAYYVQGKDMTLYFTAEGLTFVLVGPRTAEGEMVSPRLGDFSAESEPVVQQRWVVKLDFLGANPNVHPRGQEETPAVISYFKGSARPRGQRAKDLRHCGLPRPVAWN